jgi:hypothetical protein
MGLWNERPWGTVDYVKKLRRALDSESFGTRLVLVDGGMPGEQDPLWSGLRNDSDFNAAVDGIGLHYPCQGDYSQTVTSPGVAISSNRWQSVAISQW